MNETIKKITKLMDEVNDEYNYAGKHLNYQIAQEIIKDWFKVEGSLTDIGQCVLIHHVKHKGLLPDPNAPTCRRDLDFIIKTALLRLQREEYVKRISHKNAWREQKWQIYGKPSCVFGEGEQSVYLFYDYRERYIMDDRWAFYIGQTGNLQERIDAHARKNGVDPTVACVFKTDNSVDLEKQIHHSLKEFGRLRTDKTGRSWFDTSPDEVLLVYKCIQIDLILSKT